MGPIDAITGLRRNRLRSAITRPANTTGYTAGDAISDASGDAHFTFGGTTMDDQRDRVTRQAAGTGKIEAVRLVSSANQSTKIDAELWLFSADITAVADNEPFAPSDGELLTLIGVVDLPVDDWKAGNSGSGASGNAVVEARGLDLPFVARGAVLYGQLVARNEYTPVSGETLTCDVMVAQD